MAKKAIWFNEEEQILLKKHTNTPLNIFVKNAFYVALSKIDKNQKSEAL